MKYTVLLLFFAQAILGQMKTIKVEKEKPKGEPVSVIAGIRSDGNAQVCAIKRLEKNKHMKVTNTSDDLRITSFLVSFMSKGKVVEFECNSDSLSNELIAELGTLNLAGKPKIFIENVKAVDQAGKKVFLPCIQFKLTN